MEKLLDILATQHSRFFLEQASANFRRAEATSMEGDIEVAEASSEAGRTLLTQARGVKQLWEEFASRLEEQGYAVPPLEAFMELAHTSQHREVSRVETLEVTVTPATLPQGGTQHQLPAATPNQTLSDVLITSGARVDILRTLLTTTEPIYFRDLMIRSGRDIKEVNRELEKLERFGLVGRIQEENRRLVTLQANPRMKAILMGLLFDEIDDSQILPATETVIESAFGGLDARVHSDVATESIDGEADQFQEDQVEEETPITTSVVATTEIANKAAKEKRVDGDLGRREEDLLYAHFLLNHERNGFAYETFDDLVAAVYSETLSGISDAKTRQARFRTTVYRSEQALSNIESKLKAIQRNPDKVPFYLGRFLAHIKEQPELSSLTVDQVIAVITGGLQFDDIVKINYEEDLPLNESTESTKSQDESDDQVSSGLDFSLEPSFEEVTQLNPMLPQLEDEDETDDEDEVDEDTPITLEVTVKLEAVDLEPVDPKLSETEIYLLAQRLTEIDSRALEGAGIKLTPDDLEELQITAEKFETEVNDSVVNEEAIAKLVKKIGEFLKNKQEVFMANIDSEDAQYVLTILSGVIDIDRLQSVIAPNVKKSR